MNATQIEKLQTLAKTLKSVDFLLETAFAEFEAHQIKMHSKSYDAKTSAEHIAEIKLKEDLSDEINALEKRRERTIKAICEIAN